jgi:hypothetical protein
VLYREGDKAEYVFIVKEGQFDVSRTIILGKLKGSSTRDIFSNPLRANKVVNTSSLNHTRKIQKMNINVS